MKVKLKEIKQVIAQVVAEQELMREGVEARNKIQQIISEKDSWMSKLAGKVGLKSDPSRDVDDPKKVEKTLDKTLDNAEKVSKEFQASSLNTTKEINKFHDAVKDAMDKVTSLSDTLGADKSEKYKSRMILFVKDFYRLLKNESDRIGEYLDVISKDAVSKGLPKNTPYSNISGLKGQKKPEAQPQDTTPVINVDDDEEIRKLIGKKPSWKVEDADVEVDVDDPEDVKRFLRGKKKWPSVFSKDG